MPNSHVLLSYAYRSVRGFDMWPFIVVLYVIQLWRNSFRHNDWIRAHFKSTGTTEAGMTDASSIRSHQSLIIGLFRCVFLLTRQLDACLSIPPILDSLVAFHSDFVPPAPASKLLRGLLMCIIFICFWSLSLDIYVWLVGMRSSPPFHLDQIKTKMEKDNKSVQARVAHLALVNHTTCFLADHRLSF